MTFADSRKDQGPDAPDPAVQDQAIATPAAPADAMALGLAQGRAEDFERVRASGLQPGLIAKSYGSLGTAWTVEGVVNFAAAGRLRLVDKHARAGLPAVGDWVALRKSTTAGSKWRVEEILPRKTSFWRKMAGTSHKAQVVAANMEVIFIVSSLNRDFNPRRLERYLSLTAESGARPVIVLTKADLAGEELEGYIAEARELDANVPVHAVTGTTGEGVDALEQYLKPGVMVALLGSSGVGKSTLINYWLGEEYLRVNELRNDERGRHTTTHRELIHLPSGALVIDTPGMREVQLLDHGSGVEDAFDDVAALALQCRFSDCHHGEEPGCAVKAAVEAGTLDEDRLMHYFLLRAEVKEAADKHLEMQRRSVPRPSRGRRRR